MAGLRKNAVMNFAEPSGSSPPEKPPGRTIIWLRAIMRLASAIDWVIASGVRLLITRISAAPPARSTARAVSYSQFVPGKTGMNASGLTVLTAGTG